MQNNNAILIVEDEMITATSIIELLQEEDYKVIGIARNATKALHLSNQSDNVPAVVICDINIIGDMNGIELAKKLNDLYHCEIIFLTAYHDSTTLKDAFGINPVMYLVKPYNDAQLLVAIQLAFHKIYLKLQLKTSPAAALNLTNREKEIVQLIGQGLSSKEVGRRLGITLETVKTHRRRILEKNNINNFPQLIFQLQNEA